MCIQWVAGVIMISYLLSSDPTMDDISPHPGTDFTRKIDNNHLPYSMTKNNTSVITKTLAIILDEHLYIVNILLGPTTVQYREVLL